MKRIIKVADLPLDLDPHRFYLQWYGNDECLIERHAGILCFQDAQIRLNTEQGVIAFSGSGLKLDQLTESRAMISG